MQDLTVGPVPRYLDARRPDKRSPLEDAAVVVMFVASRT
jgi:hypothetical protein